MPRCDLSPAVPFNASCSAQRCAKVHHQRTCGTALDTRFHRLRFFSQTHDFLLDLRDQFPEKSLVGAVVRQHRGGEVWREGLVGSRPGPAGTARTFFERCSSRNVGVWAIDFDFDQDGTSADDDTDSDYGGDEEPEVMGALELLACLVDRGARAKLYACAEYAAAIAR